MASFYQNDSERSDLRHVNDVATRHCNVTTLNIVDGVRETEQQTTDLPLMSKDIYEKTMLPHFKWTDSHPYVLDNWLEEQGQRLLVEPDDNKELEASVREFVRKLSYHMRNEEYIPDSTEVKFHLKILMIGSYYSRTKKYPADEFDFRCESKMSTDQLRFVHQPLPSTETTDFSRPDFFRIYDANNQELKAEDWRKAFQKGLTNALKGPFPHCAIEYNGPALTFIVEPVRFKKNLKSPVKVDMTFGIRLNTQKPEHIWPLQSTHVQLATNSDTGATITPLPGLGRISQCHFVPFGDLWRVSFAIYEGSLIRNFSKEKRRFLVAIKVTSNCISW